MSFYDSDRRNAARLLFDAITDLEATFLAGDANRETMTYVGIDLGKVSAARHYLAATLDMPVVVPDETAEPIGLVEPRSALEAVS